MFARYEKMIDIPIWLHVGVANKFPIKLCNKGIDFLYFILPEYNVQISWSPRLNLLGRVILDRYKMDGREVDIE